MYRAWNRANGRSPQGDQLTGHRCVFGIIMLGWLRTGFRYLGAGLGRPRGTRVQNPEHFTRRWNIRSNRWSKLNRTTRLGEITFHRGNAALSLRRPATWRFRCVHRRARCPTSLVRVSSDARFIGRCVYSTTPPTKYVPSIRSLPFFFPWKSLDYDFFYYFIVDIGV